MSWHKLVEDHIPLVRLIANRLRSCLPAHVTSDDLRSYGYMGLCEAAIRFHGMGGATFRTYATHRIRGAIFDGIRAMDHVPRCARHAARASGTGAHLPAQVSIDERQTGSDYCIKDMIMDTRSDPADGEASADVSDLCKILSARERQIVDMKYRHERTFAEIGEAIGVSESRVCQLHRDLIARMRDYALERDGDNGHVAIRRGRGGPAGNGISMRGATREAGARKSRRRIQA